MSQTVYVGMSGGVDSSLTAALLKEQGYNVVGVYMKNWAQDLPGFHCPWREDLLDAKRVAVQLGIPFKLYDFQDQYKSKVVDYLIDGYKQGITPNPDIMCNQEIKFKLFLDTALADGADMIATGHYAQIQDAKLHAGKDESKDQTYFLYRVESDALAKTLFPLGGMTKKEVREEAKKRDLYTASKKESMGICFVGKVGIKDFLQQFVETQPGPIVNTNGEEIGTHDGALFYTIGQRHGLNVGGGLPYYVIDKNMDTNTVYVSSDINDEHLWLEQLRLTRTHWIGDAPNVGEAYQIRTRHLAKLIEATVVEVGDGTATLKPKDPIRAITPGQSCVVYDGDLVLGGGIIAS